MLANLLVFATGLDVIPPLEIDPSPSLQFDHPEDDDNHYMHGVPFANTCANCLHIPVLSDYELFKSLCSWRWRWGDRSLMHEHL